MAGPEDLGGRNKTSVINKEDWQSVADFFEELNKNNLKAIENMKKAQDKANQDIADRQARRLERQLKEWSEQKTELEKMGVKEVEAYRKKLIQESIEEDKKERLKLVNDIYEEEVKKSTKSFKNQQRQQALQNKEMNEAWLKKYKEIEESGGTLTTEQKEDRKAKEEELNLAKETLKQQTAQTQLSKTLNGLMNQTLNAVNQGISTYAKYQGGINTRLQGSNLGSLSQIERLRFGQNTFGILENRLSSATGINPYVRTETMLNNLQTLVQAGIAANVEQRAFLETVKDNIATTFSVANSSLLRIVRLQQSDSTAARLGMEAYLTRFLNNLVESTEYLNQTFDSVEDALLEASSQMSMKSSTEFEYIVQKWLGALTGTGLSESSATQIAQAIGYLGSGNVSALSNSNMFNLLTMSATQAGLDIGTLLNQGLTASTTNQLMLAMASYMAQLGSGGTNVTKSELARTFGLNISDLTSARQLSGDFNKISKSMLSYTGMYDELNRQMLAIPGRLSMGEMIQNLFDNSFFSLASGIAENPVLAAMWKVTDMIQSTTGGINIPAIEAMTVGTGGGIDINATVEQLIKLGLVGISSLGMIGDVISGLGSTLMPSTMLQKLGIFSGNTGIKRGKGLGAMLKSGFDTSVSAVIGQSAGGDIYEQTLTKSGEEAQNSPLAPAQEETEDPLPPIKQGVENIYEELKKMNEKIDSIRSRMDDEFEITNDRGSGLSTWGLV